MTIKHHIILSATITVALIAVIACQQKTQAPQTKEQPKAVTEQTAKVEEIVKNLEQEAEAEAKEVETKIDEEILKVEVEAKEAEEAAEAKAEEAEAEISKVANESVNQDVIADQEKNIVLNSDFTDGFDKWYVKNRSKAEITLDKINDYNIVKISGSGGWSTLSQKINVVEGKSYKFIVDLKCDDWSEDLDISFSFTDVDQNISYMGFPEIETGDWSESTKTIKCNKSGEAKALIQYQNKSSKGTVYIRRIEVVEL